MMKRLLLLVAVATALMLASAASAATKFISVSNPNPVYGDSVTFTWGQGHPDAISVYCWKDGVLPYEQVYLLQQAPTATFVLSGWDGSAADCLANLWGAHSIIATTTFSVTPVS